ncbi:MAG TPA: signal peptidase I [Candidatus Saccharimonadales bacterium]|jgi:signal peptidase I|nr:signal peptidase I [Candidatus Saccharimonadales bacterium]
MDQEKESRKINILPDKKPKKLKSEVLSTILMFFVAGLIAILLTTYVFQQYEVDGPSMQTTLYNQNRLIVVKYQKTWSRITGNPYIPSIGSIIIFHENGLYSADGAPENTLVKRVVALPGDRVVIQNGVLTVFDTQHPKGFDPDKTFNYGKVIGYTSSESTGSVNIVLPKNDIYVLGDNRADSCDSRCFGPINVNQIIGRLVLRIYPFNKFSFF